MTRNKHFRSVFAALLCAVLCMTAFATVAYADGGDYYDDELPPETWQEETQPEDNTIVPGTPFTEDGIASTRDLLYDKHTNKQFITVETRNGHTLYIVIDYDKLLDEEEERYQTYFLNPVDEADLMALLEDDSQNTPVVCSCTEKCTAGKVNTNCALCKTDMTNCAGKEATPDETEQPDEPTPEKKNNVGGILILVLILAAGGGGALWYFKLRKPKSSVKGGDELDEFDFDEDDEAEEYGNDEDADSASYPDEQTLLQTLSITGAVIVSTPQQVALADARKGIDMYQNDKVNVPILGLIENMAYFTPAELPENKYYIFGKEGCKNLAKEMNVPLLAQIPIVQSICEGGDDGAPAATKVDSVTGQAFLSLAQSIVTVVNRRNAEKAPTKIVSTH